VLSLAVRADQEVRIPLREKDITPTELKTVVISHLHDGHAGGLPLLEGAPVYVNKEHWDMYQSPFSETLEGGNLK
jgi:glyoxylase-like metal-dependent hydrolase (beta-lactamase superfamily II)